MGNPTLYWQGTADDLTLDCLPTDAEAYVEGLTAGMNFTEKMAVRGPFIVNMVDMGFPVTDQNGRVSFNKGMAIQHTLSSASYDDRATNSAIRMGGPDQPWAFAFSVGIWQKPAKGGASVFVPQQDFLVAQVMATPGFALVPSGAQSQGGGYETGTCPLTVLNPPPALVMPVQPIIPEPPAPPEPTQVG